jgi:hypothetical protein
VTDDECARFATEVKLRSRTQKRFRSAGFNWHAVIITHPAAGHVFPAMFALALILPAMQMHASGKQVATKSSAARKKTNQNRLRAKQAHIITRWNKQLQGMISGCIHVPLGSIP